MELISFIESKERILKQLPAGRAYFLLGIWKQFLNLWYGHFLNGNHHVDFFYFWLLKSCVWETSSYLTTAFYMAGSCKIWSSKDICHLLGLLKILAICHLFGICRTFSMFMLDFWILQHVNLSKSTQIGIVYQLFWLLWESVNCHLWCQSPLNFAKLVTCPPIETHVFLFPVLVELLFTCPFPILVISLHRIPF